MSKVKHLFGGSYLFRFSQNKMFYRLVRHQLPFRSIQTSRSFITSSSVYYNNKKEDEKKQGDSNNKDGGHKQTDHSQDAHSQSDNKPQEEKASQPSVEDQLKECNTKYKTLQVKITRIVLFFFNFEKLLLGILFIITC